MCVFEQISMDNKMLKLIYPILDVFQGEMH